MTVYATSNFGRAKSAAPVRASMDAVEHGLASLTGDVVLCCQEWDEGDVGYSDHDIGKAIFSAWNIQHVKTRDPILLKTNRKPLSATSFPAARGVPHQSPARQVNEVILSSLIDGNTEVAILGGHYPAGAHNGQRTARARVQLLAGYVRMLAVHRRRIKAHRKAGRHVVWAMDTNWRRFPKLARREVQVFHDGPDYIRAIPAKGHKAQVGNTGSIHMTIENKHDAHYAEIHFPKDKP